MKEHVTPAWGCDGGVFNPLWTAAAEPVVCRNKQGPPTPSWQLSPLQWKTKPQIYWASTYPKCTVFSLFPEFSRRLSAMQGTQTFLTEVWAEQRQENPSKHASLFLEVEEHRGVWTWAASNLHTSPSVCRKLICRIHADCSLPRVSPRALAICYSGDLRWSQFTIEKG